MNERPNAVCVDTGVLTASRRAGSALKARYRRHLTGRRLVFDTQPAAQRDALGTTDGNGATSSG